MSLAIIGFMSAMTIIHASEKDFNCELDNKNGYPCSDKCTEFECSDLLMNSCGDGNECKNCDVVKCNCSDMTERQCNSCDILQCNCKDEIDCPCNSCDILQCNCKDETECLCDGDGLLPCDCEDECEGECSKSLLPIIEYEKPAGSNGFYRSAPDVKISHGLEEHPVFYRFSNENNQIYAGTVEDMEHIIRASLFGEGQNILEVWVCFGSERWYEKMEFSIDRINPSMPEIYIDEKVITETIVSNNVIKLSLKSLDEGSGIYGYFYAVEGEEKDFVQGEEATIEISTEFFGRIHVVAVDYAGNESSPAFSPILIIDKTAPTVHIFSDIDLDKWQQDHIPVYVSVHDGGVSSGLKSIYCYINDIMVESRYFSNTNEQISFTSFDIVVAEGSINGKGTEIRVVAEDMSGNGFIYSQLVFLDTKDPEISFQDVHENMILGSDRTLTIYIEDNNYISFYSVDVKHEPFSTDLNYVDGGYKEEFEAGKLQNKHVVELPISKEGYYSISVSARDISGRKVNSSINFIMDKTSPIIRYVEQLNGSHVPFFQWGYSPEEMIIDATGFSYHKILNGRIYHRNTYVDTEGMYGFQVRAIDEAGNVGVANAFFTIDNTPPDIHIYHVEQAGEYYDEVLLGIAVLGHGERISRIVINNEDRNISRHSQFCQYNIDSHGNYEVIVEADDLAGNVSTKTVSFSVVEDEKNETISLFGDAIHRMNNSIFNDRLAKDFIEALTKVSLFWKGLMGGATALSVLGIIYILYRKDVKSKKSHK